LEVISGNLRLKIALELNYSLVPVIYCEIGVIEIMKLALSSNVHREKSLLDRYNEMKFIESYFNVTQGSRTDLNPQLLEESVLKKKLQSLIPHYIRNQVKRAKNLLKDLKIENIEERLAQDIQRIDNGVLSLNAYVNKLELEVEKEQMQQNVPDFYEIHREGFTVYNDDSYSKPDIPDKSIATIVCSPPYRAMRKYGIGKTPLERAHFLAQCAHESGGFIFREELASGAAYEGRLDLGNIQPGDGVKFKGRGYIQLTGRANYTRFGPVAGANFVINPRIVAQKYYAETACLFWTANRLGEKCIDSSILTVKVITRRINGDYNGLDDRVRRFAIYWKEVQRDPKLWT
jgi:putative chitinase